HFTPSASTSLLHTIFVSSFFLCCPTPDLHTLSLHDALPICVKGKFYFHAAGRFFRRKGRLCRYRFSINLKGFPGFFVHERADYRSEEHTSELQSRFDLVCRRLLEKKKSEDV